MDCGFFFVRPLAFDSFRAAARVLGFAGCAFFSAAIVICSLYSFIRSVSFLVRLGLSGCNASVLRFFFDAECVDSTTAGIDSTAASGDGSTASAATGSTASAATGSTASAATGSTASAATGSTASTETESTAAAWTELTTRRLLGLGVPLGQEIALHVLVPPVDSAVIESGTELTTRRLLGLGVPSGQEIALQFLAPPVEEPPAVGCTALGRGSLAGLSTVTVIVAVNPRDVLSV